MSSSPPSVFPALLAATRKVGEEGRRVALEPAVDAATPTQVVAPTLVSEKPSLARVMLHPARNKCTPHCTATATAAAAVVVDRIMPAVPGSVRVMLRPAAASVWHNSQMRSMGLPAKMDWFTVAVSETARVILRPAVAPRNAASTTTAVAAALVSMGLPSGSTTSMLVNVAVLSHVATAAAVLGMGSSVVPAAMEAGSSQMDKVLTTAMVATALVLAM